MDRVSQLSALHPESRGTARIVAGHHVDAVSEQIRHQQTTPHFLQEPFEALAGRLQYQVVGAAGVARGTHAQLACRVAAQEITFDDAILDHAALLRRHAFIVERGTGKAASEVRQFLQLHMAGKNLLPQALGKKRLLAIQAAATDGGHEMAQQAGSDRRLEHDRDSGRADLSCAEPLHHSLLKNAQDLRLGGQTEIADFVEK